MSSDLSWSPYIYEITGKARQKAVWVLAVFRSRSKDIIITLYKSMVRSQPEYCSLLWNPAKISSIQELESVQKVFTSKISGMTELNYWDLLRQLSLLSLQRRRERYIILHMWKVLHSITSNDLNVEFVHRPRLGHQAKVPVSNRSSSAFHLSAYEHSFAVMGPKLWNCITSVLNTIQDFISPKENLQCSYCLFQIHLQLEATLKPTQIPSYAGEKTRKHLLHGVVTPDGFIDD